MPAKFLKRNTFLTFFHQNLRFSPNSSGNRIKAIILYFISKLLKTAESVFDKCFLSARKKLSRISVQLRSLPTGSNSNNSVSLMVEFCNGERFVLYFESVIFKTIIFHPVSRQVCYHYKVQLFEGRIYVLLMSVELKLCFRVKFVWSLKIVFHNLSGIFGFHQNFLFLL